MLFAKHKARWLSWALLAVALAAAFGVYAPGLAGGWVFDDFPNIVDNAAIHITPGHAGFVAWVNAALSSPASFLHRPLASVTFALNWYLSGGNPWGFKFTNILIHLLNGVLLYCMLRELLRLRARMRVATTLDDGAATRLALVVAAAWLLLPINLMAVLYVVQRMESLCQVFVLAGLWAYLHGRWMMLTARDPARDAHGFSLTVGGIVLGTVLGLTSKETAVLLPAFAFLTEATVMRFGRALDSAPASAMVTLDTDGHVVGSRLDASAMAIDAASLSKRESPSSTPPADAATGPMTPPQASAPGSAATDATAGAGHAITPDEGRTPRGWMPARTDKRVWALFTITLFVPAVLGSLWLLRMALRPASWAGRDFTLLQRLMTEPRVLVDYLHWTILPNPLVLSLYHDEIVTSAGLLMPWTTLASIVLLVALVIAAVWLRNRRPLVCLGIGWFLAGHLLTATIVPLELVYEQRMYFPSIGVLLALGVLLLGLRKSIYLALPRVFLAAIALSWFGTATYLRAREWSNPMLLAVREADRHPQSARAVYEAGRLLLIASNYTPGPLLDQAWKYLQHAAAIPGSSTLPEQAMIMITDHDQRGDDSAYWERMIFKLRHQPTRQEDISSLISLTGCYASRICRFDLRQLKTAYLASLSRPHPIARLDAAYSAFQRKIMHDDAEAAKYLALAATGDPGEPAYRADLAMLYARQGETEKSLVQIDALRRMNTFGQLNGQIATLEHLAEQGAVRAVP